MISDDLFTQIDKISPHIIYGRVTAVRGMMVELAGPSPIKSIGMHVDVINSKNQQVPCEIVGFAGDKAMAMSFVELDGVRMGCRAIMRQETLSLFPSDAWLGRVVGAFGEPRDGKGPISNGTKACAIRAKPPAAHARSRLSHTADLGVRAINTFCTCTVGQRMGIFAGSGVGKSSLLSMLTLNADCDVVVIGLIGERGREVQEFIHKNMQGPAAKKTVMVVATSDQTPLMRRQATFATMAVAEYFRDQNKHVLCIIDSITRFAQAQREIGLSAGEPPTTKGYTPTVFAELPKLLERAGPGTAGVGAITGLFSVLVDGDDLNEPISDAVRSILDGHIVLDRAIAERGRYPPVNILKSISRTMPGCVPSEYRQTVSLARELAGRYANMEELVSLGAYKKGNDPKVDMAINLNELLERFLRQEADEHQSIEEGYQKLMEIVASVTSGTESVGVNDGVSV